MVLVPREEVPVYCSGDDPRMRSGMRPDMGQGGVIKVKPAWLNEKVSRVLNESQQSLTKIALKTQHNLAPK